MAFFREYAIHFDFCSRQMWTSRSFGDCSGNVGQHPFNVNWCDDKAWIECWAEGVGEFFDYISEGVRSIFGSRERQIPKSKKMPTKKKTAFALAGEGNGYTDDLLQLDPSSIRQSEAAKWLSST